MPPTNPDILRLRVDVIRGAMSARGIQNLEQLADSLSISRAMVFRYFTGSHAPSSALIAGLNLRLGLPLDLIVEPVSGNKAQSTKSTRTKVAA